MNDDSQLPRKMGAVPQRSGVVFRVWAPHADEVYVMGSFNRWSKTTRPLRRQRGGYWTGTVEEAAVGDEYRYRIVNGDQVLEKIDPYARAVTSSAGNAIVCDTSFDWAGDAFELPSWNELVVYEMHIGTLNNDDHVGDVRSVIEKLPYLRDLGVNLILVMPPVEFPGDLSWGYNPAYIFAIESNYGRPENFKQFIREAHKYEIGVLIDVVYNHFGPDDLDLWRFDGWYEGEYGGIYFYNDWRAETPWGATRPDYGRPEVRRYIYDNALMWIEEYHVDGLRWDGTLFVRNASWENNPDEDLPDGWSLMQWVNQACKTANPRTLLVAEDLRQNEWITRSVDEGGAGFDVQWDPNFVHPVRKSLETPDDAARDMHSVAEALTFRYNGDAFRRIVYTESHDEVANGRARLPYEIDSDHFDSLHAKKRSTLGAGLVFTAPGIPMLFQGQEFLEDEWFRAEDPLDWSKTERFAGILRLYKDLIRLRLNRDGHTAGLMGPHVDVYHVNDADKVIAYHRWQDGGAGDSVVVLANFANRTYDEYTVGLPTGGAWQVRFNSDCKTYDAAFGDVDTQAVQALSTGRDGQPYCGSCALGAYALLVLSQS